MIVCERCGVENKDSRKKCSNCGHPFKKRKRGILLVFVLLVSFFFFSNIGFYVTIKKPVVTDKLIYVTKEVSSTYPVERDECGYRSFAYSAQGGNVDSLGVYVRPYLLLINLEEKWGYYSVNFSYIDESKFPFDVYGGQNLLKSIEDGKISVYEADFSSENFVFLLGPGERITISNRTLNENLDRSYWAIANINEPKYYECKKITDYINKTENRTFTEYKKVTEEIKAREYRTITDLLGIKNFWEWIILIFMLILIIILIIKIRQEKKHIS